MLSQSRRILRIALILALSLTVSSRAPAQAVPGARPAAPSPAEQAWEGLLQAAETLKHDAEPAAKKAGAAPVPTGRAAKVTKLADQAKDFYTKNPQHSKANEAKRIEAHSLIEAAGEGDVALKKRMADTVKGMRQDRNVPARLRAEIAGSHDFTAALRACTKREQVTVAFEKVARGLIAEFPDQPQGYESLLTIAGERDERQGRALALELLRLPAPDFVKQGAQFLHDQLALLGQPLEPVLKKAGAETLRQSLRPGRATVIYTWACWSPGSLALGEMLATRKLAGINLIGINLEQDAAAAGKTAADHHLPGLLHYDSGGMAGALATALKLNAAPRLYLIDAKGVVRDVRGLDDLEEKLRELGL